MTIYYSVISQSRLGMVLAGFTSKGVCYLQLIDSETAPDLAALQRSFPNASLVPLGEVSGKDYHMYHTWLSDLTSAMARFNASSVPLDMHGTAFQQQVWQYLITIPSGETRSYARVASDLGRSSAVRAVASACAKNNIAVLIPCHRVIRSNGELAGYRWGLQRKKQLLALEAV